MDPMTDVASGSRSENPAFSVGALARGGNAERIAAEIERGANVNVCSPCGWSPLSEAAWGGHVEVARLLLRAGIDVDGPTHDGLTPLMIAAARGHSPVVRLLCAQGARIDRRSKDGRTAVESALQSGHLAAASLLHAQGAQLDGPLATLYVRALVARQGGRCVLLDPSLAAAEGAAGWRWIMGGPLVVGREDLGPIGGALVQRPRLLAGGTASLERLSFRSAVEFVAAPGHPALREARPLPSSGWRYRCGWTEHMQMVLYGEVPPDTPDQFGYLPLLEAIRNGEAAVVSAVVAAGADVHRIPHYGCMRGATLLINAAERGDPAIVQTLLRAGADIDVATGTGWTATMVAASRGHVECVQLLVDAGADLTFRNAQGQTALAVAQRRRHAAVARTLLVARNTAKTTGDTTLQSKTSRSL